MTTRADIANETNRKLYQNHLASMAKLREARLRIEQLEAALAALCGAVSDFLRTDVDDPAHGYIEEMKKKVGKARAALEVKDG